MRFIILQSFLIVVFCLFYTSALSKHFNMLKVHSHKFKPQSVENEFYDRGFLSILNKMQVTITPKITFSDEDINFLTESQNNVCILKKCIENLINKYKNRISILKCVNTLIMIYIERDIKSVLINNELTDFKKWEALRKWNKYLARMLSVLYYGHIIIDKWTLILCTKLLALDLPDTQKMPLNIDYFKFVDSDFDVQYEVCQKNHFLERRLLSINIDDYFKKINFEQIIKDLYNNTTNLEVAYIYEELFTEEYLTLSFLQNNVIILDKVIKEFNWDNTKEVLQKYKDKLETLFNKHMSLTKLNTISKYHSLIQQIVYVNVLYFALYHLQLFKVSLTRRLSQKIKNIKPLTSSSCTKTEDDQKIFRSVVDTLRNAIILLDANDNLLLSILQLCKNGSPGTPEFNKIELDATVLLLKLFDELNVCTTKKQVNIVKDHSAENLNLEEVEHNVKEFSEYVSKIAEALKPIQGNLFYSKFLFQDHLKYFGINIFPYVTVK
ncbi:uncharacterized protein LOC126899354 isoform X2 [Daktulosphaira vitifoliae]|uniref:uncharacterized protein LOC126899354 isoform X2 n=1 Tax=Daktulosphaira vitifoliae TaxID=58002 RepID=UPI0021A9AB1B|nr:uncharacterized protein LOC126899354 isoform X2 [Daktulosphaira vitifoliae]